VPQNENLQPLRLGWDAFLRAEITNPDKSLLPSEAKLKEPRPWTAVYLISSLSQPLPTPKVWTLI